MRQEATNTFSDGLIQDLNPINTPDTVLTDNLNGTFITYDGNEHVLQNDRGNYELKNCKLKPNYIPVGVKEYGDTIYIVSYNPIDGSTEIGSYPSPLDIDSTNDSDQQIVISSVVQNAIMPGKNYSELMKDIRTHIFDSDEFKIYPGDEYQLNIQNDTKYPYEELSYFIIDEEKNKYDITNDISENNTFAPVAWTSPGWLGAQYRLWSFDEFKINLRSITIPSLLNNTNGTMMLNFQFMLSDMSLIERLQTNISDLHIQLDIKHNDRIILSELLSHSDLKFQWIVNAALTTIWANYAISLTNLNANDIIQIVATPVILFTQDNIKYKIKYDLNEFKFSYILDSLGSFSDYSFGTEIWKFWVESANPEQLYLDVNIDGPIVSKGDVKLYYTIHEIEEKVDDFIEPDDPADPDSPIDPDLPIEPEVTHCPMCDGTEFTNNICTSCGYDLSSNDPVDPESTTCPICNSTIVVDNTCQSCGHKLNDDHPIDPEIPTEPSKVCPDCGGTEFIENICISCGYQDLPQTYKILRSKPSIYHPINNYHLGRNLFILDFNDQLQAENIYVIEFILTSDDILNGEKLTHYYSVKKLVITSKLFENFIKTHDNFDDITFDEWVKDYYNLYKNNTTCVLNNLILEKNTSGTIKVGDWSRTVGLISPNATNDITHELNVKEELKRFWTTTEETPKSQHTTFVSEVDWKNIQKETSKFLRGYSRNLKGVLDVSLPSGKLFESLYDNCEIQFSTHGYAIKDPITLLNGNLHKSILLNIYEAGSCNLTYKNISGGIVRGSLSDDNSISYLCKNAPLYSYIYGYNVKRGSNDTTYIDIWHSLYGLDHPSSTGKPQYESVNNNHALPSEPSEALLKWMSDRNINFGIVFLTGKFYRNSDIGVALYRSDNTDEPVFSITGATTTNILGDKVKIYRTLPALIVRNGNVPLLFLISGFDQPAESEPNVIGDPQAYRYFGDLRQKIQAGLQNIIYVNLKDLISGVFLSPECVLDTSLKQNLNIDVMFKYTNTWYFNKYNLLSVSDRIKLQENLNNTHNVSSKLFSGNVSQLDQNLLNNYVYNNTLSNDPDVTAELIKIYNILTNDLSLLTQTHWNRWQQSVLYKQAQTQSIVSGLEFINDTPETQKLKNSSFFELLQQYYDPNKLLDLRIHSDIVLNYDGLGNDATFFPFAKLHPSILVP